MRLNSDGTGKELDAGTTVPLSSFKVQFGSDKMLWLDRFATDRPLHYDCRGAKASLRVSFGPSWPNLHGCYFKIVDRCLFNWRGGKC